MKLDAFFEKNKIVPYYQSIYDLKTGDIYGHEVLSRGINKSNNNITYPETMLELARQDGRILDLEMAFMKSSFRDISKIGFKNFGCVFYNIEPDRFFDSNYISGETERLLNKHNLMKEKIILEITERTSIINVEEYKSVLRNYRDQGFRVAIDDLGSGYSSLVRLYELSAEFIKIDKDLIRNIESDYFKQSIVQSLVSLGNSLGILTVAEGIETYDELKKVIDIGIDYAQGYYLSRPQRAPLSSNSIIKNQINLIHDSKANFLANNSLLIPVKDVCARVKAVNQRETGHVIKKLFEESDLEGVCLVDDNDIPRGVMMRTVFYSILSRQYGNALYLRRPISNMIDSDFAKIKSTSSIFEVSKIALGRQKQSVYDCLVVVDEFGRYLGLLFINELLKFLVESKSNYELNLNPLTNLPGNNIIDQKFKSMIEAKKEFSAFYIDIDNFKVINDLFGFKYGDRLIIELSKVIQSKLRLCEEKFSFLGHIGGDDFIIIIEGNDVDHSELFASIIEEFNVRSSFIVSEKSIEEINIDYFDRLGNKIDEIALTVSIAGTVHEQGQSKEELIGKITLYKKHAKQIKGNSYYFLSGDELISHVIS